MMKRSARKLVTSAEAKPAKKQHHVPCGDCPFSRNSMPGWLGGNTPEGFVAFAQGEGIYNCHSFIGPQCAGMAIFRSNICKSPRDSRVLVLPANRTKVFGWPTEFIDHHGDKGGTR